MAVKVLCLQCSKDFQVYAAQIRKGGGKFCSYMCMGESRRGKATYVRTLEQNAKMSELVKQRDLTPQRTRFLKMNASRKGKTFNEIYGNRADEVRARYGKTGAENSNWKGGKHRNKYPWAFFKIRQSIIDRDGNKCMNCDMTNEEHKATFLKGTGLTIHHIDYDKENNIPSNLVTLCIWCNCKANGKRKEWQTHYSALLS